MAKESFSSGSSQDKPLPRYVHLTDAQRNELFNKTDQTRERIKTDEFERIRKGKVPPKAYEAKPAFSGSEELDAKTYEVMKTQGAKAAKEFRQKHFSDVIAMKELEAKLEGLKEVDEDLFPNAKRDYEAALAEYRMVKDRVDVAMGKRAEPLKVNQKEQKAEEDRRREEEFKQATREVKKKYLSEPDDLEGLF